MQPQKEQQKQERPILAQSLVCPLSVSSAMIGSSHLDASRSSSVPRSNTTLALSRRIDALLETTSASRLENPPDRAKDILFQQGAKNQSVQRTNLGRESPYLDVSKQPDPSFDDDGVDTEGKNCEKQSSKSKKTSELQEKFPMRLFRMLDEAEKNGDDRIVSFFSHGKAFAVHRPREFVTDLMPKYFSTTRMSSFQRQLNLYGFQRISEGQDKGGYFHEYFIRGSRNLCTRIRRKKVKRREIEVAPTSPPAAAAAAPSSSATSSINNPFLAPSANVLNQLLLNLSNQQLLSAQLRQQQLAALALQQQILESSISLSAIPANLNLRMGSSLGGSLLPCLASLTQQNSTTSEANKLAAIIELLRNQSHDG